MKTEATKKTDTTPYTFADWERGDARPAGFTIEDAKRLGWSAAEHDDFGLSEAITNRAYQWQAHQKATRLLFNESPQLVPFLYGQFLSRGCVSVALSLPGVMISEVMVADALAMVKGGSLCADGSMAPVMPLHVAVWSEAVSEAEYLVLLDAMAQAFGVRPTVEMAERFAYLVSKVGPFKGAGETRIRGYVMADLLNVLGKRKLDVLIVDVPSVTAADVPALGALAHDLNCAIQIVYRGDDHSGMDRACFVARTARMMTRHEARAKGIPKEDWDRTMSYTMS